MMVTVAFRESDDSVMVMVVIVVVLVIVVVIVEWRGHNTVHCRDVRCLVLRGSSCSGSRSSSSRGR